MNQTVGKSPRSKASMGDKVMEIIPSALPQFVCTAGEIKYPKKDFVIKFYVHMLEALYIDPKFCIHDLTERQEAEEEHKALYIETGKLMNLKECLRHILNIIQSDNILQFGIMDLLDPKPERTHVFMFTLLNFFNYCNRALEVELADKFDLIGQRQDEMAKLLDQRQVLAPEIKLRSDTIAQGQETVREIREKIAELNLFKQENASYEKLSEAKKAEIEKVKRDRSKINEDLSELRNAIQKCKEQQVQSPDSLKFNHHKLEQTLQETKQRLEEIQETVKIKKNSLTLFTKELKDSETRLIALEKLVNDAKQVKELGSELADVENQIKADLKAAESLQGQMNLVKKDIDHLASTLTALQLRHEKTKSSMKENIRHLEEEGKALDQQQNTELESTLQSIAEVQREVFELVKENDSLNELYERLYKSLIEKETAFVAQKSAEYDAMIAEVQNADFTHQSD